ncbi:MAG TPA: TRAP transporter large permease subunit [Vicinamibacterales bacterium]|nr:TRAP transporter large permease subunit [Vicinamibacterales bacterium]
MIPLVSALEDGIAALALAAMVVLPIAEIIVRRLFGVGIPGSGPFVQHLTLWIGFLGAAIAAREGKLLSLATGTFIPDGRPRQIATAFASGVAACMATILAWGAVQLVVSEREVGSIIAAGVPTWVGELALPIGFVLIALRLAWRAGTTWSARAVGAAGILVGVVLSRHPELLANRPAWPGLAIVLVAAAVGAPIFAILGGAAVLLFMSDGVTPATVLIETYSLSVSPTLPAIPLFTLAGFILAEGQASSRLLRVFRAWFGWIPGGTAVVCAILCTFFTAFTGGSGVTILAVGGVLFPALLKEGYRDQFSLGLLTTSGSLGLLLPPSLPLILYAVVAQVPIEDLFIGGILPGILLTAMIAAWGVREGMRFATTRHPFRASEAGASLWAAKWELLTPMVVVVAMFSGLATAVEAAAVTALYAFLIQTVIHRDLSIGRDLLRVFVECVLVIGGVLVILGVAVGLTNYLVGVQLPAKLVNWVQAHIESRLAFLLALNVFLVIVGWLMEIFAAIVVVVPLIVPLGAAFGINPVHLGIIFVANLELGFLTPLVGINIFLASYRFKRPVLEVCRAALPFMAILAIGVLVITYVPWLTTGLLALLRS